MRAEKLITVIIPVYNVEPYLRQCLDSVIGQTYRNTEILLIDDGSTDDSGGICDSYARRDGRIRVFHTENQGLSSARNLGLDHAAGDYLCFVDGDDWIEANALEILACALEEHGADLTAGGMYREWIGESVRMPVGNTAQLFQGKDAMDAFVAGKLGRSVWNRIYLSSLFSGVRFPLGRCFEDVFTNYKLMQRILDHGGAAVSVPERLYHYRCRKSSIVHCRTLRRVIDKWEGNRAQYEALPDYRKQLLPGVYKVLGSIWMNYGGLSKEERKRGRPVLRQMRRFSREHLWDALGKRSGRKEKAAALASQFSGRLWMRLLYHMNRLRKAVRYRYRKMYD